MISVVIPMYNSKSSIERCIDSVKNQDYRGRVEILIVNDGCTDGSQEIVQNYAKRNAELNLKIINQNNGGVSKARNTGIKNCTGDFIAFLDADDSWFAHKLSTQMNVFKESDYKIDFLSAAFDGLYFKNRKAGDLIKISVQNLIYKNYFQPSTVIMKKEIIDKVGYFDENQHYAEEGNYFIRIAKYYCCFFLNTKLINYGDGKSGFGVSGLSSNLKEMQKGVEKNITFAHESNYINYQTYITAMLFSKLKYIRRILIVKFRKWH